MLAPRYLTFYDLTMDFASTDFRRCLDVALDALGNCLWSVIIQSRCPFFVDCAFVPLLFIPVLLTFALGWGLRLILVLDLIVRRCSTFFSLLNIFGSWSLFTFVFDARSHICLKRPDQEARILIAYVYLVKLNSLIYTDAYHHHQLWPEIWVGLQLRPWSFLISSFVYQPREADIIHEIDEIGGWRSAVSEPVLFFPNDLLRV